MSSQHRDLIYLILNSPINIPEASSYTKTPWGLHATMNKMTEVLSIVPWEFEKYSTSLPKMMTELKSIRMRWHWGQEQLWCNLSYSSLFLNLPISMYTLRSCGIHLCDESATLPCEESGLKWFGPLMYWYKEQTVGQGQEASREMSEWEAVVGTEMSSFTSPEGNSHLTLSAQGMLDSFQFTLVKWQHFC